MKNKLKFYSLKHILAKNAQYNIIFGERSNGKTYAVELYALKKFCEDGKQLGLVRRFREDFRGKRGQVMFNALVENGEVIKYSKGKFSNITYSAGKWYLSNYDEKLGKNVLDSTPFCYGFALSDMEHDKSTSYPNITTVLFDEMLTRRYYLPDEFVLFMNTLSTIIRYRNDVKIFMLGNTVNKYCPYFTEMGLTHVQKMKKGDIDVYSYGETNLKVAVEYADSPNKNKPSDLYFAFNNPKLGMITGGEWEINLYPHCPYKYSEKDILFTYFIIFEGDILQAEIIQKDDDIFTFIHRKSTPIRNPNNDVIYSLDIVPNINHHRNLLGRVGNLEKRISYFFLTNKVFYQDNEVGEIVRNYIITSQKNTLMN